MKEHRNLRMLTEGAVFTAMAVILSLIPLYKLPQGGSLDLAMLPIFIYCARWGFAPGMLVSFVYALLQMFIEGGIAIGWQSIVGDFILAYAVLGVAGLFHKQKYGLFAGIVVGSTARFLVHYVVGATIWAEYMPESFFDMTMTTPWLYSALYNGAYMLPDMVLCLIIGAILIKPLGKYIRGEDLCA